jgi:hypothetical protein
MGKIKDSMSWLGDGGKEGVEIVKVSAKAIGACVGLVVIGICVGVVGNAFAGASS